MSRELNVNAASVVETAELALDEAQKIQQPDHVVLFLRRLIDVHRQFLKADREYRQQKEA